MRYRCLKCNDVVESSPVRWRMMWCSCEALKVDNHNPPDLTHRVLGSPGDWEYIGGEEEEE